MNLTYRGASAPDRDIGNGIHVTSSWMIEASQVDNFAGSVAIDVVFDPKLERFAADAVRVVRGGDGTEVTGVVLREIRVQDFVQQMATHAMFVERVVLDPTQHGLGRVEPVLKKIPPVSGRSTAENVRQAAFIYRVAQVLNVPPLKSVADLLKVSQSTATRLVAKARSEGFVQERSV
ncbi:MAG: hypothetical protein ACQEW8_07310 [Actinomycetota bacterium]